MNKQTKVLITDYAWENVEPEREILSKIGADLVIASSDKEEELINEVGTVNGILTCWAEVTKKVIEAAKKCQVIGRYGVGVDNVAIEEATRKGIIVTNVPTYCTDEVSEHAMALLFSCARKTCFYTAAIKKGQWNLQIGNKMFRLRGKTLGLIGFGKNGCAMASKAKAFGLKVIAFDPYVTNEKAKEYGIVLTSLDELLNKSDFVSAHIPLIKSTHKFFNEEKFKKMKTTAYLINTARGGVVDAEALLKAIKNKWIAGAGLDVLPQEPPDINDPLLKQENIVLTPHAAFCSVESLLDLQRMAASSVSCVLQGKKPEHIVNPDVLNNPEIRTSFIN